MVAKMLLLFFLFFNTIYFGFSSTTIKNATCSTTGDFQTYNVDVDTAIYFRTPNFPATMYKNGTNKLICNAHFQATDNNMKMAFLLFNGATGSFTVSDGKNNSYDKILDNTDSTYASFESQDNNLFFSFNDGFYPAWTAFEAIIYSYDDKNFTYPFTNQIIKLDKDMIIPISISYHVFAKKSQWSFEINPNQYLKIFVKESKEGYGMQLKTDGYVIDNYYNRIFPRTPKVFYYGSYSGSFTLTFTGIDLDYYIFVGTVSVVDELDIDDDDDDTTSAPTPLCDSTTNGINTDISLMDYENGYLDYAACHYPLTFSKNAETVLHMSEMFLEKNVDNLTLIIDGYLYKLAISDVFIFTKSFSKEVMLNFNADGTMGQAGFRMTTTELDCQCSSPDIIVPCSGNTKITTHTGTEYYCSKENCTFNIVPDKNCSIDYLKLSFSFSLTLADANMLSLYFDNNLVDTFTSDFNEVHRIIPATTTISFNFYSNLYPSSYYQTYYQYWSGNIAFYEGPTYLPPIYLSSSKPYNIVYLKEIKENSAIIICSSDPTDTLELYISEKSEDLTNFLLYDSTTITNYIGNLNSDVIKTENLMYPNHISSSSGCFTLLNTQAYSKGAFTLFKVQKGHANNCVTLNNVFRAYKAYNSSQETIKFNNSANENGPCTITLMAETMYNTDPIRFKYIKTSSNDTYQILSSKNKRIYFKINSMNPNLLKYDTIFGQVIDIIIPKSQSIELIAYNPYLGYKITFEGIGQRGSLSSASYGGFELSNPYTNGIYYKLNCEIPITVEFFVKEIVGISAVILQTPVSNISLQINQTLTIKNTDFQIIYPWDTPLTDYFLIEYNTPALSSNQTLTSENDHYYFSLTNLKINDTFVICGTEDEKLEMFVSSHDSLYKYIVYDCKGLCNKIGALYPPSSNHLIHISSTSNCFTILNSNGDLSDQTILFRIKNKQNILCPTNNIFPIYFNSDTVEAIANDTECEILIFAQKRFLPIQSISSNGEDDNYIFKIASNGNFLMNINNTEADLWQYFLIYTDILSITFTKQISLTFYARKDYTSPSMSEPIQNGIFISPSYGGISSRYFDNPLYKIVSYNGFTAFLNLKSKNDGCMVDVEMDKMIYNVTGNLILNGAHFAIKYYDAKPDCFLMQYTLINTQKYAVINLNEELQTHAIWLKDMNTNDAITVCSSGLNTLQLFISQSNIMLTNYSLFDGVENLGTLASISYNQSILNVPKTIVSKSGCFTLYKVSSDVSPATVLFTIKTASTQNCLSPSNIYEPQFSSAITISATAASNSSCKIIILTTTFVSISSFNVSASNDTVILQSAINQKHIAEISENEIILWKDLYFYSPALSVIIPAGQNISFELESMNQSNARISKVIERQKGVLASPGYNGVQNYINSIGLFSFSNPSPSCGITFEVKFLSFDGDVILKTATTSHSFTQNDKFTTFENNFDIEFSNGASKNTSFLIEYKFESCSSELSTTTATNNPTTTFLSTTTLTTASGHKNSAINFSISTLIKNFIFCFVVFF